MKSKCYSVTRESKKRGQEGDRLCPIEQQREGRPFAVRHPRPLIQLSVSVQRPRGEIGIAVVVESETIIAQSSGQQRRVWITAER